LLVLNVQQEGKEIWNTILLLLEEWKPDQLLVGKPLNMDGTPSDMMKKVEPIF
jgi:putative Holliday junction resolvase